eukprot:TRINITY_DN107910_c0_g1_i1.p1 TRINITY_DN107910_c0_g1~~TRINITY_DN107910_c0_g1_i1.p1  ORF type:complete len:250 (+),score=52.57 TRINITY_DN107910_c0_g1_i1:37-750(+)
MSEREKEDLGWLAQSTSIPKKRKTIEGITGSSLLELQAQFYKGQEAAADGKWDQLARKSKRHAGIALFNKKNSGVEERIEKDEQHVKSSDDVLNESRVALERKAELYDKLARGEVEDDNDVFEVDFFEKTKYTTSQSNNYAKEKERNTSVNDHMNLEHIILKHEQEQQEEEKRRRLHKEFVMKVASETTENRDKSYDQKLAKQEQLQNQRKKLKQAFLRKQKDKLQQLIKKNPNNND